MLHHLPGKGTPKIEKFCDICGDPFMAQQRNARYCSIACRAKKERNKFLEKNPPKTGLATGTVGAISELLVSTDLLSRGYEVFRALSPSCSCDLAILKDGKLHRVEVRTGYLSRTGQVSHPKTERDTGRQDIFAVVVNKDIHYLPCLP